ncbi:hypothetical protein QBC37DRAFT_423654 [Rhypophila decipiens]|uniref:Uncharacterized protein n=1 Tax=Rhypophila decipiens TaxID=261697 RepID=A0AAN7B7L6_9PEZI|nr:hypothetical protein QBC37DRAFT_423654 [Rhypophila decipiens]
MAVEAKYLFIGPLTGAPPANELHDFLGRLHLNPLQPLQDFRPQRGSAPPYTTTARPEINKVDNFEWLSERAREKKVEGKLDSLVSGCLGSVKQQGRSINAQTLRIYTLQQEQDYLHHFMEQDKEAKSWALEHLKGSILERSVRVFLAVGMITVMEAELKIIRAINAEKCATVSFSDLLADASGIELLRRMNVEIKATYTENEMAQMKAKYVEEHVIGIQWREIGTPGIFYNSRIKIVNHTPFSDGTIFGGSKGVDEMEEVEAEMETLDKILDEYEETGKDADVYVWPKHDASRSLNPQEFQTSDTGKWLSLGLEL